jgi:AcrR family transcriptional regulator
MQPAAPMRADARRNRARLLAIAHEAFVERGVGASMDDIARRAGVGPGTLYRHFPTRDDLILVLVAGDLERLAKLADDLAELGDDDSVHQWLAALIAHDVTYRGLAETVVAAIGQPTLLGAACARLHESGAKLVATAQAAGTIRADLDVNDPIDLAASVAWITERDTDSRRRTSLLRIVMDGIRTAS